MIKITAKYNNSSEDLLLATITDFDKPLLFQKTEKKLRDFCEFMQIDQSCFIDDIGCKVIVIHVENNINIANIINFINTNLTKLVWVLDSAKLKD